MMSVRILDICFTLFQTFLVTGGVEYYESNKIAHWREAGEVCNVAIPRLQVTPNGFLVVSNYSLKHEEAWIGVFIRMTAFEYIGCMKLESQHILKGTDMPYKYSSPGLCYTVCKGHEAFGITPYKCFCFVKAENYTEVYCKYACGLRDRSFHCGGKRYLSVYRVMEKESEVRENSCLRFERNISHDELVWDNCTRSFRALCDDGNVTTNAGLVSYSWRESVNMCFQNGLRPASFQSLGRVQESSVEASWLAVISSDVIYDLTELKDGDSSIQYGYISADGSVHFTDSNDKKYILCNSTKLVTRSTLSTSATSKIASTSTLSTSAISIIASTSTLSTSAISLIASTSTLSTSAISKITSTTTSSVRSAAKTGEQGLDGIVVTIASVSAVLVAIAAVAAFVFLVRRYKIPDLFCRKTNKSEECSDNDVHDESQQTAYENVKQSSNTVQSEDREYCYLNDMKNENYAHNYLVVGQLDNQRAIYENTE